MISASQIVRDHMAKHGSITPEEFFTLYNLDANRLQAVISGIEHKDNMKFGRVYCRKRSAYLNNGILKKVIRYEVVAEIQPQETAKK